MLKNSKVLNVKEKKEKMDLEEEKKTLEKLTSIQNNIEKSRVVNI